MEEFIVTYFGAKGLDWILSSKKNVVKDLLSIRNELFEEYSRQSIDNTDSSRYSFWGASIFERGVVKLLFDEIYSVDDLYNDLLGDKNILPFTQADLDNYIKKINDKVLLNPDLTSIRTSKKVDRINEKLDDMPDRIVEKISTDLSVEFKRQLNLYKKYVSELKLKTALDLLNELETKIAHNEKSILSMLYYLKACCDAYLNSSNACSDYIRAYKYDKNDLRIKQCALFAYITNEDLPKALLIAEEIINDYDDYDPYVWLARTFEAVDLNKFFNELPKCVLENIQYKRLVFDLFYKGNTEYYQILRDYHIIDDDIEVAINISYESLPLWTYKANLLFNHYIHGSALRPFRVNVYESLELINLNEACKTIYSFVKGSEIIGNFNQLFFLYYYTQFERTNEKKYVIELDKYSTVYRLPVFASFYANCKQLVGDFDKALEVLENSEESVDADFQIKIAIGVKTKNENLISDSLKQYINGLDILDNIHIFLILSYADHFQLIKDLDVIIKQKQFKNAAEEQLWNVYVRAMIEEDRNIKNDLDTISKNLPNNLKSFVASLYAHIGEFQAGATLLDSFINKDIPSFELDCYIRLLYYGKIHNEELLRLLKHLREKFEPLDNNLIIELELRMQCRGYKEAKIIAELLYSRYPEDERIIYNYVIILIYTDKEELRKLKDVMANFRFRQQEVSINVGNAYLRIGEYSTALDIVYNSAEKESNTKARLFYLNIIGNADVRSCMQRYNTVCNHSYVTYSVDATFKKVYIDEDDLNRITSVLLNKHIDDNVEICNALGHSKTVSIIGITDKYFNLLEVIQESINDPILDLPVESIKIPSSDDPNALVKELTSRFGKDGDERQNFIEETLKEYKKCKVSFLELTCWLCDGDYIKAYQTVISDSGLYVRPKQIYEYIGMTMPNESSSYALDFTSLLLMFQIYQSLNIIPKHKFIISQLLVDKVDEYKYLEMLSPNKLGFLSITTSGISVTRVSDDYKDCAISFYSNLKVFIDENCIVTTVPEKLDIVRQIEKMSQEIELFFENAMLATRDNVWLISDDSGYSKMFKGDSSLKIITTETYLGNNQYGEEVIKLMLQNRYYGLTLSSNIMYEEYAKYIKNQPNYYDNCLLNIEYNPLMWSNVVEFVKKICLNNLSSNEALSFELTNIFVSLLRNVKLEIGKNLYQILQLKFRLLPQYNEIVCNSFESAWKILHPLV